MAAALARFCCTGLIVAGSLASGVASASSSLFDGKQLYLDDHGTPLYLSAFKGKPAVVGMEYSDCRYICSTQLTELKAVQSLADRHGKSLEFIIISVDPENDSPSTWTQYRKERGLNRDNWHFLTTNGAETRRIAAQLGVRYWTMDGHIIHDFKMVRTNESGQIIKVVDHFDADLDVFLGN